MGDFDRDPREGTVLDGRYRLDRRIGEGGMGAVFAGTQLALGRRVAIKLLHPEIARNASLLARFRREAELAASLGHPNIVQVTDFGEDAEGRAFLVMDYVEGRSLAQVLLTHGPLAAERAAFVATQVLSALGAAHRAGVVHRDLKPDNVLLTQLSGVDDVVKLLDFGIARLAHAGDVKMTATGQVLGTPAYMSPEQARGEEVDHRTDLYAVGVLLYECLTGRLPFEGDNYHQLMFAIVDEEAPPILSLRPDLDPGLAAVVHQALSKDLEARYPSAEAMSEALAPYTRASVGRAAAAAALEAARGIPATHVTTPVAYDATITPEQARAIGALTPRTAPVSGKAPVPAEARPTVRGEAEPRAPMRRRRALVALAAVAGGLVALGLVLVTRAPGEPAPAEPAPTPAPAAPTDPLPIGEPVPPGTVAPTAPSPTLTPTSGAETPRPRRPSPPRAPGAAPAPTTPPATGEPAPAPTTPPETATPPAPEPPVEPPVVVVPPTPEPTEPTPPSEPAPEDPGPETRPARRPGQRPGRARTVVTYSGGITNDLWPVPVFRSVLTAYTTAFTRCYATRPFQSRDWVMTLRDDGTVSEVRVAGASPPDAAEYRCMSRVILRIAFPPIEPGHGNEATFYLAERTRE